MIRNKILLLLLFFGSTVLLGQTQQANGNIEQLSVIREMEIPQCKERGLQDKIILITSEYCHTCHKMEPFIMTAIEKNHLNQNFQHLIISNNEDKKELNDSYKLKVTFLPVLIVNGKSYIGGKQPDFYNKILSEEAIRLKGGSLK